MHSCLPWHHNEPSRLDGDGTILMQKLLEWCVALVIGALSMRSTWPDWLETWKQSKPLLGVDFLSC